MYIIRLDDASEYMDVVKWEKIENLLDKYDIKPIVGIIPENKDKMLLKYKLDENFWIKAKKWESKGWSIAMHGYQHLYQTEEGGINPIQNRSEFAGLNLSIQRNKIKKGYSMLLEKKLHPCIFFAPSHTFDDNTIYAILKETDINVISDTIAYDVYYEKGIYYIPQQSGKVRRLPFKISTFCYHPNEMTEEDYIQLENFLNANKNKFGSFNDIKLKKRKKNIFDFLLKQIYFQKRRCF